LTSNEGRSARECFDFILESLRKFGMRWLADQIISETSNGRLEREKSDKKTFDEYVLTEYSDQEALAKAICAIDEYTEVLHFMWAETVSYLRFKLNITTVGIYDDDLKKSTEPFLESFSSALGLLKHALDEIIQEYGLGEIDSEEAQLISRKPQPTLLGGAKK